MTLTLSYKDTGGATKGLFYITPTSSKEIYKLHLIDMMKTKLCERCIKKYLRQQKFLKIGLQFNVQMQLLNCNKRSNNKQIS